MSQMPNLFFESNSLTPEGNTRGVDQNGTQEPKAKRRKIDLACEQCRNRKARCNGVKPICGNCAKRQEQCVYKMSNTQMSGTNDYINSLLTKISSLEDQISRMKDTIDQAQTEAVSRILVDTSNLSRHSQDSPQTSGSLGSPPSNVLYMLPKRLGNMDAMGTAPIAEKKRDRYFGTSSTASLMEQVFKVISREDQVPESIEQGSHLPKTIDQAIFEGDIVGEENFALLPRTMTDFLLNRYWDRVHTLYPILHRPTFMQSYEQLWHPNEDTSAPKNPGLGLGESEAAGPQSFMYHTALNVIMILGLQFTDIAPPEQDRLAFICLQKVRNLFRFDSLDEGSLAVCQTLILLTQYFQSTTSPGKCWNCVGLASRIAQGLGLHTDNDAHSGRFKPIERELRRRVWFGCLTLDMIIGMALGRPIQLRRRHKVPLPEATDDEYLINKILQPPDHHSDLSFYVESLKLFRIMRRTISLLYKDDDSELQDIFIRFDRVIELDQELTRFLDQVPDALHWKKEVIPSLRRNEVALAQQRHVLHLRFLHQRLLLYRPLLIQYCRATHSPSGKEKPSNSVLQAPVIALTAANSASMTCVLLAIELAESTDQYSATPATGEWWYNMFYARTAAMVIMMGIVCEPIRTIIGAPRLESAWQSCRDTLQKRLPANIVVKNCLETLDAMYQQVLKHQNSHLMDGRAGYGPQTPTTPMLPSPIVFDMTTNFVENGAGFNFLDGGYFADPAFSFGWDDYGISLL